MNKLLLFFLIMFQCLVYSVTAWAACPGNLDDTINTPVFGYQISYTNDDNTDPDFFTTTNANRVSDALDNHHQRFTDLGFATPFFNTDPEEVCIYDSSNIGGADFCQISLDSPFLQPQTEPCIRLVTGHELFHHVQYAYINNGSTGCGGCGGTWGKWTCEGTARLMQDKIYTDLDQDTGCITYLDEINNYLNSPNITLTSASYKAALFWNYLTEQLGSVNTEPERGVDVIERYWDNTDPNNPDSMQVLRDTIQDFAPSSSLEKIFHNFSITNYTKEFDVSAVPDNDLYQYIDESAAGGGSTYGPVSRSAVGFSNFLSASSVNAFASRYLEAEIDAVSRCIVYGFRGEATDENADLGWTVIGIKSSNRIVELHKGRGNAFYKAFVNDPGDPFIKLAAVVTGLSEGGNFNYVFAQGSAKLTIERPTFSRQAYVGEHADPDRFQVRLNVTGPSILTPDGTGTVSVKGLSKDNFLVFVEAGGFSEQAQVLTGAYVGGQYWLSVQAPVADPNYTFYNLRVCLCEDAQESCDVQEAAVVYVKLIRNQMLVIDRSGSMSLPSATPKLNAAQAAANIFVDAAATDDKLGVVSFTGDQTECNDDSELRHDLQDVDNASRIDAKYEIDNINAGGWTGIGDGMVRAQNQLDALGNPGGLDHIVLLSDGMENEALCWDSSSPNCSNSGCGSDVRNIFTGGAGSNTIIDTIAFGPQTDQNLLQDIAATGAGDYYYVDVTDVSGSTGATSASAVASPADLTIGNRISDVYLSINDNIQNKDRIFFASGMASGTVNQAINISEGTIDMVTFAFSWEVPDAVQSVKLFDPDGNTMDPGDADIYTDSTHKVYQFKYPVPGGAWHAEIAAKSTTQYMIAVSGKFKQSVQADLYFSQLPSPSQDCYISSQFVAGLPMTILVSLADMKGGVRNADVLAQIDTPDGLLFDLPLYDDGQHDDGDASDGIYGNIFTRTSAFSQTGVPEKEAEENPGKRGSYIVSVEARGIANVEKEPFTRLLSKAFQIYECYVEVQPDRDGDGMPDRYELLYPCLDPGKKDADQDPDQDGLTNEEEYNHGTNPCDPDTDNGGELDGSEVNRGANPLNPRDDDLPRPFDAEVITTLGDEDPTPLLFPSTNTIRYPSHPAYRSLLLLRGTSPRDLKRLTEIYPKSEEVKFPGIYFDDDGLLNGQRYYYQLIAMGHNGSKSTPGPIFTGVPKNDPIPPKGWVIINKGALTVPGRLVSLKFDMDPDDVYVRVTNGAPSFGAKAVSIMATDWEKNTGEMNWELEPDETGHATVYVQFMDEAGNESVVYHDSIIVDPDMDLDEDGIKDGEDNCFRVPNRDQKDRDEDKVGDACDNCPDTFNPDQRDSNFDGIGNACECPEDLDGDGDVDGSDAYLFLKNFTGSQEALKAFALEFGKNGCTSSVDPS